MHVLIAYASAHGSTAEVARYVATTLTEAGLKTTLSHVSEVSNLDDCDAVVLGSPVHAGMWLPEMSVFVSRRRAHLRDVPVYAFLTCIRVLEPGGHDWVMNNYVRHLDLRELNVRGVTAFAGKVDVSAIDMQERWTLAMRYDGKRPAQSFDGDFRNWATIRMWSEQVAYELSPR